MNRVIPYALCVGIAALAWASGIALADEGQPVRVPFVGCPSDGQMGPTPAPHDDGGAPHLPSRLAEQLAYYRTPDLGVLAPQGWTCFGVSGSNGSSIIVTPDTHSPDELFKNKLRIMGPAIQLSLSYADTSGRFHVAKVDARLFPSQKRFVQSVIDEGLVPASEFKFGPFPHDRLKRRGERVVEFETPASEDGAGTQSFLVKNGLPIKGVAILTGTDKDLLQLFVRLPADGRQLTPTIIDQIRR